MSNDKELAKWAAGLEAEDEPTRAQAAKEVLSALARPGFKNSEAALSLLQASWWPLTRELIPEAVAAVLSAVRGMALDAPALEDASLLLGHLGREDTSRLEALEAALRDPAPTVRRAAAGAVGRIGEAALGTLPLLIECLRAPEEEVGGAALESLGTLGSLAPEAIAPALLAEAERSKGARRYLALAGLRGLLEEPYRAGHPLAGVQNLGAVALLGLADEEPAVRLEAAALLGMASSGPAEGNGALERSLRDPSPDVAAYSAIALLRRGAGSTEAPARLRELLFSDTAEHRFAALSVLDGLEPSIAKQLRAVLDEAARQGPEDVRALCHQLVASADVLQSRRGPPA
ncbi:HEAT repeat domain-containing protein [Archangium gephyra]|uniref:HEAT repeat domain-containing protein n=1 Tax=Archangium gephyra TaxID=48 RepID=UPI003B7D3673